ncbi:MAG: YbhB/YbcL family Raf kinase inhibitor-like protein [Legionellaceae bacterium]|nr:YbhB/YbcL family Raf kinase inhibitor-like protein [Legionellaceae bacterium]
MKTLVVLYLILINGILFASESKLLISSPVFANKSHIPKEYSFKGRNVSPPLDWSYSPNKVKSYALIMIDYDTVERLGYPVVHWVVFDIPAQINKLVKGDKSINVGLNSYNKKGYIGMNPPKGEKHSYTFELYALDIKNLNLVKTPTAKQLNKAMQGHIIEEATIIGTFKQ